MVQIWSRKEPIVFQTRCVFAPNVRKKWNKSGLALAGENAATRLHEAPEDCKLQFLDMRFHADPR